MGIDQRGWFERVTINRKDNTVAVDRLDIIWLEDKPFVARRELFMPSKRANGSLDFIRHSFWIHKACKFGVIVGSHWSAFMYRRSIRNQEDIKPRQ